MFGVSKEKHCRRLCFQWVVERPLEGSPRMSARCNYDNEFDLHFSLDIYKCYNLRMNYYGPTMPKSSSERQVIVHVEDRDGCALRLSSYNRFSNRDLRDYVIWCFRESQILHAFPDFHSYGLVTFLVTILALGVPDDPIKNTLIKSTTEKSVQTPSYMDIAPCFESLSEDLSGLTAETSYSYSDVTLACGDRKVRAHRCVLSARSRVFSAMLQSDMAESRTGVVEIRDMDPTAFEQFVRYLYTGNLPGLTVETARRLYEAGDQYDVKGLSTRCACFLEENLEPQNACEMLTLANAHSDGDFKEVVINYIVRNKINLLDGHWLPFCERQPKLALEVTNRFFKKLTEDDAELK